MWKRNTGDVRLSGVGAFLMAAVAAVALTLPLPVLAVDGEPGDAWRYEGEWTSGDKVLEVRELRSLNLSDGGRIQRAYRTIIDERGSPFSWQNETQWWDGDGAVLRSNATVVTHADGSSRRIGIDTVYDKPCAPAPKQGTSTVQCSGVRTVLGVPRPFQETVTYKVIGTENVVVPTGTFDTTRVDADRGSTRMSVWSSDKACGSVREEVVSGDTKIALRLVSGGCGQGVGTAHLSPDGTPVGETGDTNEASSGSAEEGAQDPAATGTDASSDGRPDEDAATADDGSPKPAPAPEPEPTREAPALVAPAAIGILVVALATVRRRR